MLADPIAAIEQDTTRMDMTPEMELVLSCASLTPHPQVLDRIFDLSQHSLDWEQVINIACQHHVLPFLYWHIQRHCSEVIPQRILRCFELSFKTNLHNCLLLTRELILFADRCRDVGIPLLAIKGPTLASLAYDNVGLRQFLDIDVLVPAERVKDVFSLLQEWEYTPQYSLSDPQLDRYIALRPEMTFWHASKNINLDLHWRLMHQSFSFSDHPSRIWEKVHPVKLSDRTEVDTLTPEILLMYLCAHASKHNWSHLMWICDINELICNGPKLDWDLLLNSDLAVGNKRMLLLGLSLSIYFFDTIIPAEASLCIAQDQAVFKMKQKVIASLGLVRSTQSKRIHFSDSIYLGTMDQMKDKLWYWIDLVLTPTPKEWLKIPLPMQLFVLYYPIRILRLLGKYLQKPWGSACQSG